MSTSRRLVACLGDAFVDVQVAGVQALPGWGEDAECQGVSLLPGGSCANAARHLASIGREELCVSFFTCVGDDEFGRWFLSKLRDEGLLAAPDQSVIVRSGVPQSTCIVLSGAADRAMVSCYSSNRLMQAEDFEQPLLRGGGAPYAHLHIGGYFNCAKLHTEALLALVRALRAGGARVSLDTQFDASELWTGCDGHLRRLLPLLDVLLFNETEGAGIAAACVPAQPEESPGIASIVGGASDGDNAAPLGDAPLGPALVLERLASAYPQALVVIKCGADGVLGACGAQRWEVGCYPTAVVDTTGAGDAFNAGFLHRYVQEPDDVGAALRSGCAAGALCVAMHGACPTPIAKEAVEGLMGTGDTLGCH